MFTVKKTVTVTTTKTTTVNGAKTSETSTTTTHDGDIDVDLSELNQAIEEFSNIGNVIFKEIDKALKRVSDAADKIHIKDK